MQSFVLIREYSSGDRVQCEEVIKDYIMSCGKEAFITILFKEITLQLMILICALFFIFFGFPPMYCLAAIPAVLVFLFVSVYGAYFNKAIDLCNDRPLKCFVAEVHYQGLAVPSDVVDVYTDSSKQRLNAVDSNRMRKKIVGAASVRVHDSKPNSGWLYGVAFSTPEHFTTCGVALLQEIIKSCATTEQLSHMETVVRECDDDYRELLTRAGFSMRNIYSKKIVGNSLKLMKAQFGIDVSKWTNINRV